MKRVFVLDEGTRRITLGQVVAIVRAALQDPDARFDRSFCGWWPASGHEILRQFRRGLHDRINLRGGIVIPDPADPVQCRRRLRRLCEHLPTKACAWCGTATPRLSESPRQPHFCDPSCRRSFYS